MSMVLSASCAGIYFLVILFVLIYHRYGCKKFPLIHEMHIMLVQQVQSIKKYHDVLSLYVPRKSKFYVYTLFLDFTCQLSLVLSTLILLMSAIIYPFLKSSQKNTTHAHQYSWYYSSVFTSGTTAASLILVTWISLCLVYIYMVLRKVSSERTTIIEMQQNSFLQLHSIHDSKRTPKQLSKLYDLEANATLMEMFVYFSVPVLFLASSVGMNVLYIYLVHEGFHGVILLMTFYKIFGNMVIIPCILSFLKGKWNMSFEISIFLMIFLMVFHNVYSPFVAGTFEDTSCFASLIFGETSIQTSYVLPFCTTFTANGTCTAYAKEIMTEEFIPPFIYNNTCYSSLSLNYIPLFIVVYTVLCVCYPLVLAAVAYIGPGPFRRMYEII